MARFIHEELKALTKELEVSPEDARSILGLQSEHDPLLQDFQAQVDEDPVRRIQEMFPKIPADVVQSTWENVDGDDTACCDILLNYDVLREVDGQTSHAKSNQGRKQAKLSRKRNRNKSNCEEIENKDVQFLADLLNCNKERARELYWLHNSNVTQAMFSTMHRSFTPRTVISGSKSNSSDQKPSVSEPITLAYSELSSANLYNLIHRTRLRIDSLRAGLSSANPAEARENHDELIWQLAELREMQLALLNQPSHPDQIGSASSLGHSRNTHGRARGTAIDLHGTSLAEAQACTRKIVQLFKESRLAEVEIITGAGNHSIEGKSVIRTWVKKYLKSLDLRVKETEGSFIITQRIL